MTGKQVEVFSKLKYLLKINKILISRYRNRKFAIYFCHAVANLEGLTCTDYNDMTSPQALLYAMIVNCDAQNPTVKATKLDVVQIQIHIVFVCTMELLSRTNK